MQDSAKTKFDEDIDDICCQIIDLENKLLADKSDPWPHHFKLDVLEHCLYKICRAKFATPKMMTTEPCVTSE